MQRGHFIADIDDSIFRYLKFSLDIFDYLRLSSHILGYLRFSPRSIDTARYLQITMPTDIFKYLPALQICIKKLPLVYAKGGVKIVIG